MHFAYAASLRFVASAAADFWMPTAHAHAGIMTSHSESDAHLRCDWMKRSAAFFSAHGPSMKTCSGIAWVEVGGADEDDDAGGADDSTTSGAEEADDATDAVAGGGPSDGFFGAHALRRNATTNGATAARATTVDSARKTMRARIERDPGARHHNHADRIDKVGSLRYEVLR
jgi:hypothetical protein